MAAVCLALAGCGADDAAHASRPDEPVGLAYLPPGSPTRPGEPVRALAALSDGRLAAAQGDDVVVWSVDDPAAPPLELHGDRAVASVAPDGGLAAGGPQPLGRDLVVAAGADGTVEVRRPDHPDEPPVAVFRHHRSPVLSLAVLSDGRVASGDADGVVHVWSARFPDDGGVVFDGHGDTVTALAETTDSRLASASLDGTVQVWDPSDLGPGRPTVIPVGEPATALAALDDGRLAVGTASGTVQLVGVSR